MLNRCYNPNVGKYKRYGGRGIRVCENLRASVMNLVVVLGEIPSKNHSIGRPNNDGSYACGACAECIQKGWTLNVRWETEKQQVRNKSTNRLITVDDVTKTQVEWCEITGVPRDTMNYRLKMGVHPFKRLRAKKTFKDKSQCV